jgi:hypothetical protein
MAMPTMPVSLSVIDAPETDLHHHFEEIRFSLAPIYISVVSGGVRYAVPLPRHDVRDGAIWN